MWSRNSGNAMCFAVYKPGMAHATFKAMGLKEGETLSAFVEASVREQVRKRQLQEEFVRRGLIALEQSSKSGDYLTPGESLARLDAMLKPRISER